MTPKPRRRIYQRLLESFFAPLARLLDTLYRSAYNPLYRSGTLAIGMLFVLFVTGLYLVFMYNVGQPYESIQRIQNQVYFGRWIRAMHRYATDLAIVAVVFHVIQMMIQGRTWGPRVLAWLSGVILLGALYLSTWTGYVMMWDSHAHWLSTAGAEMAAVLPPLRHQIMRTFSGADPLTGSFFFMNLFLHVAIPLVMIAGIWIHTARLNRPRWLPAPAVFISLVIVMAILSMVVPAPLLPKADLLTLPGRMPVDLFSSFWLPLKDRFGVGPVLLGMTLISLGLTFVPWYWRPRRDREPSSVDTDKCKGCMQCYKDCPFEAISMVKRDDGTRRQFAAVDPDKCVTCGLCGGSCDDFNVGPPGLKGDDQIEAVEQYLLSLGDNIPQLCLVYCETNLGMKNTVNRIIRQNESVSAYTVACAGNIHAFAIERLLKEVSFVVVVSCPEENCVNRRGHELAVGRLLGRAGPHLSIETDLSRVRVVCASGTEFNLIDQHVRQLLDADNQPSTVSHEAGLKRWSTFARIACAHTVLLLGIAVLSMKEVGSAPIEGVFRVVLELPGQEVLSRRAWTQEELAQSSSHMRLPEKVEKKQLNYSLIVEINDEEVFNDDLAPRRDGRLVRFTYDRLLESGTHSVRAFLVTNGQKELLHADELEIKPGQVQLFNFDGRDNVDASDKD